MRDLVEIKKFIEARSDETLVLCTLVRKSGSSYRGLGSKKIISLKNGSSGLLSGGCLENAIEMCARDRVGELPFVESFSTLAEEDRLLGYQTGCQGVIDVLFEELDRDRIDVQIPFGTPAKAPAVALTIEGPQLGQRSFVDPGAGPSHGEAPSALFTEKWISPIHLYVVGCGADADAYLPIALSMGWRLTFLDYRSDLTEASRFAGAEVEHVSVEKISDRIQQGAHIAVILMTHNYEADCEIMKGLKDHHLGYLGCLGPAVRYERMQKDLWTLHQTRLSPWLKSVIVAPIGIFTHSSSPEAIALSVVAQIQQYLVETPSEKVWTLILAAGQSKRFGGVKALAEFRGRSLLAHAVLTARSFSNEQTLVVTGGHAQAIAPQLQHVKHAFNERWAEGMGTSIAKGIKAIRDQDSAVEFVVVLPVDQPFVETQHLVALVAEAKRTDRCVLTSAEDFMGPPAVIPKRFFARAEELSGDRGLKSVLTEGDWTTVFRDEAAIDFDSPEDFARYL